MSKTINIPGTRCTNEIMISFDRNGICVLFLGAPATNGFAQFAWFWNGKEPRGYAHRSPQWLGW